MTQRKIIDVSAYNGTIDWKKVKKYGCDGAIIKIIRKDLGKDKKFEENYKKCEKLGIPWGVYNYTYATTVAKAKSDMKLVCDILDKISKKHFKYGVWFDIEDKVQAKLTKGMIASIINAAQTVVESRGYKFGVYTGKSYFAEHIDKNKVKCKNWWIARYYKGYNRMAFKATPNKSYKPTNVPDLMAWQYTSSGVFPAKVSTGNGGKFDLSILYHDFPAAAQKEETTKNVKYTGGFPKLPPRGYYKFLDGITVLKDTQNEITKLQDFLNWAIGAKLKTDGKYGEKTEDAVRIFQSRCNLKNDGKFGTNSLKAAKEFSK